MTVRPFRQSDLPALRQMAEASGYPYPAPDSEKLAACMVVVDEDDQPIMAAAAEQIWQMYLWCGPGNPHEKAAALRMLHEELALCFKRLGIESVEAFLPPTLARKFGRRLERMFGWTRNWASWNRRV